jgi:hypothetical protein
VSLLNPPGSDWGHLGDAIRYGRRNLGYTQEELANRAGVDRKTIGNYEAGRIPASDPRVPDGYYQVARVLGWEREDVQRLLKGIPRNKSDQAKHLAEVMARVSAMKTPASEEVRSRAVLLVWEYETIKGVREGAQPTYSAMERAARAAAENPDDEWAQRFFRIDSDTSDLDSILRLYPAVTKFARMCIQMGADPQMRDTFDSLAEEMLTQASGRKVSPGVTEVPSDPGRVSKTE